MLINYRDLIRQSKSSRKEEYISYFFKNIVGTDEVPTYCKLDEKSGQHFDISITKNYKEKISKIGNSYIGKYLRTCVFYCIDREDAILYLNSNGKVNYSFGDETIKWDSDNGFKNNNVEGRFAKRINYHIFKYFKKARSSWFVRSFVYFVLIVCDNHSQISSKDFYISYWNSKYEFKDAKKTLLFGNNKKISFVSDVSSELENIRNDNKEVIDCVAAYLGKLDYYQENEEAFTDIKKDMNDCVPFILCRGAARTGKTILALRLLNEYPDFKLLLMNYNFYVSLKSAFAVVGCPFPRDRIFHHDLGHKDNGCWIIGSQCKTIIPDISRLIVDEAQRLGTLSEAYTYRGNHLPGFDSIDSIVNCDNHIQTVFFGDDSQMLNPKFDRGMDSIKKAIGERDYREYYFSSPLGVPPELLNNIRFLLNCDNSRPYPVNNFNIDIESDSSSFIRRYQLDEQKKKHLVIPLISDNKNAITIGDVILKRYNSNLPEYLFSQEIQQNYFLTAYSVISREIESVYLYIPKEFYLDENGSIVSTKAEETPFLINHLYTIMTRATLSLVICCEDDKLGEFFNERTNAIKEEVEPQNDVNLNGDYDYDVFIAYFGTDRPEGTYKEAKRICDMLKAKGLSVFLNNYSFVEKDKDLKFTETWHALNRSETLLFVFNEYVDRDASGLVKREFSDGSISRIYQELNEFQNLIDMGTRKAKYDARFFYSGRRLTKFTVYPFLNRYYPPLTQGNSNCCFMSDEDMNIWIEKRFKNNWSE